MKKICIIGAMNIKHMSLISLYTTYFDKNGIPYDLINLDKYGIDETTTAKNHFCLKVEQNPKFGKFGKLLSFIKFRLYAIKVIKTNKYDLIITWQATTAYLFADYLIRRHKKSYIVNIRDYIIENKPFIRKLLSNLVKNSAFSTISSEGFYEFLPVGKYIRVNSINEQILTNAEAKEKFCIKSFIKIKIGFVGNCRFFKESYKLIDSLANNDRFEIWYCGTNSDILKKYAEINNIKNVFTKPAFALEETLEIVKDFNMVNSAFGNDAIDNRTLMPIRLYTAISMHIPVLASDNSQLAKEIAANGIGYVIKDYEGLGLSLFQYFTNLDYEKFTVNCDKYIEKSRKENSIFTEKLTITLGE